MLPKLVTVAKRINLLDWPDHRKVHAEPTPLVGGFGFVISACFASALFVPAAGMRGFFAGLTLLLFIGFLDDLKEIGHNQKFISQILAVSLLIYFSNIRLISFGDILETGELIIPGYWASVFISIFCILGVINSINLIDGLDGLAGGIGFVAFLILAAHASFAQNQTFLLLNLAFAGAMLGVLRFNWHPAKLFMGDAGSLCLGFTLAFMALAMTQGTNTCMPPIAALLILAVPISDTVTVLTKRIIQGKNPFHPDKRHLHHTFMRYGFSRKTTVKVIIGISTIFGCITLLGPLYKINDSTFFLLFVCYFTFYFICSFFILDFLRYTSRFRRKSYSDTIPYKLLRLFFQVLDTVNILRKDDRYEVSIEIQSSSSFEKEYSDGTIKNISKNGFMASIPQLTTLGTKFSININCNTLNLTNAPPTHFTAEHIWISVVEDKHIHGFKFSNLTKQQKSELNHFIDSLNT